MRIIIKLIIFMYFLHSIKGECKPSGRQCLNDKQFIFCIVVGGESTYVGDVITCPGNTICNDVGFFACDNGPLTTVTETTKTDPPSTTSECPTIITIPTLSPTNPTPKPTKSETTKTTASSISPGSTTTASSTTTAGSTTSPTPTTKQTTTTSSTITTTNAPITPPTCKQSGKYQAPLCNQYYECVRVLWWYELVLKTCPNGKAFSVTKKECVPSEEVNCTF